MNIGLELFGYLGTSLIILSMMMSSVVKLRIFNICGSVVSAIYAVICNTWPIVLLNVALMSINIYKLVTDKERDVDCSLATVSSNDDIVKHFLNSNRADMEKSGIVFPKNVEARCWLAMRENNIVGILLFSDSEEGSEPIIKYVKHSAAERLFKKALAEKF